MRQLFLAVILMLGIFQFMVDCLGPSVWSHSSKSMAKDDSYSNPSLAETSCCGPCGAFRARYLGQSQRD